MNPEFEKRLLFLDKFKNKADVILLWNSWAFPNPNFRWATNCSVDGVFYYDFDEPAILASEMELRRAEGAWPEAKLLPKDFYKNLKGTVAVDASQIPAGLFQKIGAKKVDVSENFAQARAIKTPWEVGRIKGAVKVAKAAYRRTIKTGTEAEIKARLEYEITRRGAEPAFPSIVATGKNIRVPHHVPGKAKATKHLLIDWGVRMNGYCSDITRTQGNKYQKLLERILEETYGRVKPGAKCADLHNFVVRKLGKLSEHFIHNLGHGLGTAVHELPVLGAESKDVLEPGMVFTIEPGLYLKGGLRIENMFLCTEDGYKLLTDF